MNIRPFSVAYYKKIAFATLFIGKLSKLSQLIIFSKKNGTFKTDSAYNHPILILF